MAEYFPSDGRERLHPETLLTTTEAAKLMNVTDRTIRTWCNSGAVPCFRVGGSGHRRIRAGDLYAYRLHDDRGDLTAAAPPERVVSGWAHVSDGWGGWRPPRWAGADQLAVLRRDAGVLVEALEDVMRACDERIMSIDRHAPAFGRSAEPDTIAAHNSGRERDSGWGTPAGIPPRRPAGAADIGEADDHSPGDAVAAWLNRRDDSDEILDRVDELDWLEQS